MLQVCAAYVRVQVAHRSNRVRPGHPSSSVIHTYIHTCTYQARANLGFHNARCGFLSSFPSPSLEADKTKTRPEIPNPSFLHSRDGNRLNGLGSGSRSPINHQLLEVSRLRIRASSFELWRLDRVLGYIHCILYVCGSGDFSFTLLVRLGRRQHSYPLFARLRSLRGPFFSALLCSGRHTGLRCRTSRTRTRASDRSRDGYHRY